MQPIYLICYGNSEENVEISLKKRVIGASNNAIIPTDQLVYLIVKREKEWTVVARALIQSTTEENPFEKPNRYKCYTIKDLDECMPFSITEVCKNELGNRYGLVLRAPKPILVEKFIKYLESNFKTKD